MESCTSFDCMFSLHVRLRSGGVLNICKSFETLSGSQQKGNYILQKAMTQYQGVSGLDNEVAEHGCSLATI